jgi:hypothetical protein
MFDEIGCTDVGCIWLIIVIYSLCISPFISIECPFLSQLINVSLKSNLSINIATPACFGGPLSW